GYLTYVATLKDGRTLTGLLAESTSRTVTLLDAENRRTVVNRRDIDELSESRVSLMPEGLLDALSEQQIRDLFALLRADALPAHPETADPPRPRCPVPGPRRKAAAWPRNPPRGGAGSCWGRWSAPSNSAPAIGSETSPRTTPTSSLWHPTVGTSPGSSASGTR